MINLIIPTLIIATLALVAALAALVLNLATRWSTHKIEWKPLKTHDPFEELEKSPELDDDNRLLAEAISMQRKGKIKAEDPLDQILESNNF
jgi:hypothetical protein